MRRRAAAGSRPPAALQGYVRSRKGNGFRYTPPRAAITFSYVTDAARVLPDIFSNTTRNYRAFTPEDEMSFLPWLSDLVPWTHRTSYAPVGLASAG